MTIALLYQLAVAQLDGVTPYAYAADDWARDGQTGRFIATLPVGVNLGIVDPLEHLLGLENTFGPFLGRVSPDVGARAKLTSFAIERVIFDTTGQSVGEFGTHSPANNPPPAGWRLRVAPFMSVTESAGILQGGGVGQVSTGTFAAGQSGIVTLPVGLRWFAESAAAAGAHAVGMWITPLYAPRDLGGAVRAQQPPAVFI